MTYRFHPEALDEYQEATLYYAERDPLLAVRFVEAVEDAIRRILDAPNVGEFSTTMCAAVSPMFFLTESSTPSNSTSSSSLL
jgi:plasmid stabilization system protein ParE